MVIQEQYIIMMLVTLRQPQEIQSCIIYISVGFRISGNVYYYNENKHYSHKLPHQHHNGILQTDLYFTGNPYICMHDTVLLCKSQQNYSIEVGLQCICIYTWFITYKTDNTYILI